jgi:hypothetical protein
MPEEPTLRSLAEARGVYIGAALWPDHISNEPDTYGSILPQQFNSVTLEHHHKWGPLLQNENKQGVYSFDIVSFSSSTVQIIA